MSEQKMRDALERIKASLWVDDPYGHYDIVCEALATPAGVQVGLTDAEIKSHEWMIDIEREFYLNGVQRLEIVGLVDFARAVIAAHEAKRNGAAK